MAALHEQKIPNDGIRPHYVVVGEGSISMEKLNKAHELIEKGARLVATNPDNWCPVGHEKTRPRRGRDGLFPRSQHGNAGRIISASRTGSCSNRRARN